MLQPNISVIIPCRNEAPYIEICLESVIMNDYPNNLVEVLVIDGLSNDETREIVHNIQKKQTNVKLIDNPNKTVPYALNIGIKLSKGDYIIRIDAHSIFPKNYFSKLIEWQIKTSADNVGGSCQTLPGNNSKMAHAIALATSSRFGVGNALFRIDYNEVKAVDTVPFGCYKREVFERIGFFDEELTRNQDDEFNARLINNGGKIILVPDIKIKYFARSNLTLMSKMFYQYGLFKPLVNIKLGKPATVRQFAPPIFVFGILIFPILCYLSKILCFADLLFLSLYFLFNLYFSVRLSKNKGASLVSFLFVVFFLIHVSYGVGYLNGFIRFVILKKRGSRINNTSR